MDEPTEIAVFDAWLNEWRPRLTFVSANTGCGCCVNIYEVDGPTEAIYALPAQIVAAG